MPPVVDILIIELKVELAMVLNLQVEFSFVVKDMSAEVVFEERVGFPVGAIKVITGGVVSVGTTLFETVTVTGFEVEMFPERSLALAMSECEPFAAELVSQLTK